MMCNVDETESVKDMRARVGMQLIQHLESGPFFGGFSEPSLIDLAILPQVIFSYLVGLEDELVLAQIPQMNEWLSKITAYLPDNPLLVPDFMVINPIVDLFEELGQKSYA